MPPSNPLLKTLVLCDPTVITGLFRTGIDGQIMCSVAVDGRVGRR